MKQKKLYQINFKSYVELCISIAIPFGFIFGVLSFIISLFGGNAYSSILLFQLSGIPAGIANLIIGPITLALMGLFFGIISYIPFKFYLKMIKGIIIKGKWGE